MRILTLHSRWLGVAKVVAVGFGCLGFGRPALAQTPPLEIRQTGQLVNRDFKLGINWGSYSGVPLSSLSNNPAGSDGRAPTLAQQIASGLTTAPPTTNQFKSFLSFGAVPVQGAQKLSASLSFAANAEYLDWPRGKSNQNVVVVLRSAQVGASYFGQQISYLFGSVIPMPATAENGLSLTNTVPEAYWLPEPFTANGHTNAPYYWSPNARAVFANQAGRVDVTWKKASPLLTQPADYNTNPGDYSYESGVWYRLYTAHYLVSGSPVKPPQKIFWTEGAFRHLGKAVDVPQARVSTVNVAYNSNFPRRTAREYTEPGQVPMVDTNRLEETRTLWFDSTANQILAYNVEGRAFVELLGELNPDGVTRRFLGFEIVDVFKQATPTDATIELGEKVTAYQDGRDDSALYPSPILQLSGLSFYYEQRNAGNGRLTLYAARETSNPNDFQAFWLQEGVAGLRWPLLFMRYQQVWPSNPARYSHYLRPLVATEAEAQQTAVPLPTQNAPYIQYQDPLDQTRGKLTHSFAYYSFLAPAWPAHRALIRYTSGDQVAFERVFSWLDSGIRNNSVLAGSVATNLSAWKPGNLTLDFTGIVTSSPRLVTQAVNVGDRVLPPVDEAWNGGDYWAGYILQTNGTAFNPGAYVNPFEAGFDQANQGAIIPVNAIPGKNLLEVWWHRISKADGSLGFLPVYWPSVMGRYTIQWPAKPREIILASNAGSGALESLQAVGNIYFQNDPARPGYNPNEEHALMLGGQAYALRDDLNILTSTNNEYSSAPFVLIDYKEADGRPAMVPFKVRREKPEEGILFDYIVEAGIMLQAPMPLPLIEFPVEGSGAGATNYNSEPGAYSGDLPGGWDNNFASGAYSNYSRFTYQDRKNNFWVYRGLHSGLPPLQAGYYNAANNTFGLLPPAVAVVNQPFSYYVHTSRRTISLTMNSPAPLPEGLSFQNDTRGLSISGTPLVAGSNYLAVIIQDTGDNTLATNYLSLNIVDSGNLATQGPLAITSTNQYSAAMVTFTNRPPQLAQAPVPTNCFTMQFYYKNRDGFAWPGVKNPPALGAIVPYLRPKNAAGTYLGDPAAKTTESLNIVYRPVWPAMAPTLFAGETLTLPKRGLAAVRGQSSAQLIYQQSIARSMALQASSAVLFDPTRDKLSDLAGAGLEKVPASVRTDSYQGRLYFPALPPHLARRLYVDPNRGPRGSLVFKGQFMDEPVGEKYLLLNVLAGLDLQAAKGLCPKTDAANKSKWDAAVDKLASKVETFFENPAVPGQYIPNPQLTFSSGVSDLVAVNDSETAVDSYALSAAGPGTGYITYIVGNGRAFTPPGEPVSVYVALVLPPLYSGQVKVIPSDNPLNEFVTFQHTSDLAGDAQDYQYDWRIAPPVDGFPPVPPYDSWTVLTNGLGVYFYTLGGSGIQALSDNYIVVRYRAINPAAHPGNTNWSSWTTPQLAEGWIKRVLAGINPFNQRTTDLFNNQANTTASIISLAGHRWEGDIALNLDTINNYGLIEIYETVLNRGKNLSINAGINYGPANDALLLASGYLNDLYMMLGNEAWADAANPTIGAGTKDNNYGSVATALFAFRGQVATLLEEELALLRGRDDFLQPGVVLPPVYNRLFWNYTRGINAGEVIYALNYNITDQTHEGVVNGADAAAMYPQGHGDAYGHFLSAIKNYYSLLMNPKFDWVPRIEAVTVLGAVVSVDYLDERKFAAAAGALARTGRQILDLAWRQAYQPAGHGWSSLADERQNPLRLYSGSGVTNKVTRYWGVDHWASRVGQGSYVNWVVGNAILPADDVNPAHEGIQKVDRTTVPELKELTALGTQLQTDMDNAEGGLTPLGLPLDSIPFDINPYQVTGPNPTTHFEQVYQRAVAALNNAVVTFDDAKNVTQVLRSTQDSVSDFQSAVDKQEQAYNDSLIDLYGTPYPDDTGPGKTYVTDYSGPDLIHYMYVETPEQTFGGALPDPKATQTFKIDVTKFPADWQKVLYTSLGFVTNADSSQYTNYVQYHLGPHGFLDKPADWASSRRSPGSLQQAISGYVRAHDSLSATLQDAVNAKRAFDKSLQVFQAQVQTHQAERGVKLDLFAAAKALNSAQFASDIADRTLANEKAKEQDSGSFLADEIPKSLIFGMSTGGDQLSAARGAIEKATVGNTSDYDAKALAQLFSMRALEFSTQTAALDQDFNTLQPLAWIQQLKQSVADLGGQMLAVQNHLNTINQRARDLDDARRRYQQLVAQGDRIQSERETFRQKSAAVIQGYRVRDTAFRIFRDEKLERYKTLFDLSAQYAFLAAQAFDYETGLLNTAAGKAFLNRIVGARALGVIINGQPQYAGSDTGDPGLSSTLAEMKADWDVLKNRLGFNNADGYSTTVSLRTENFRILRGAEGDNNWKDVLQQNRVADLLSDPDVLRYCLQIDDGSGLPVPGIILSFSTTIADGRNLFGQFLAPGDHSFSAASFATKIFSAGVDLDGYVGMDNPAGIPSPGDPTLDPNALAATPYVYLIPVGVDSMRSPPLGDNSAIRTWSVDDVIIPLPFNIGASDYSGGSSWQASDSLSEPLFAVRKHQAFRPVSTTAAFTSSIYGGNSLARIQYTNCRLIGRSIWNSKWKLVIPGKTLLQDPNQGLDRFLATVKDVKLYFVTYSYSGN